MEFKKERNDLLWLWTLVLWFFIPFHALLVFNMNPESVVPIKDSVHISAFKFLSDVIDRFHLPLLFCVAGTLAFYVLQTCSVKQYVKKMILWLLPSVAFSCCVLNPVISYMIVLSSHSRLSFLIHVKNFFTFFTYDPSELTNISDVFSPLILIVSNMYIIIYLLMFSIIATPFFIVIKNKKSERFNHFMQNPYMMLLFIIPVTLVSKIIMSDLTYFCMLLLGFYFSTDVKFQIIISKNKWVYMILSVLFLYLRHAETFHIAFQNQFLKGFAGILYALIEGAATIVPVYAFLGIANSFINRKSRLLQYTSHAAFIVFIFELFINTLVSFFIVPLEINALLKFVIILVITFILCVLSFEVIKRIGSACGDLTNYFIEP